MTHLSVSISNEHCFGDTTLEQPVCHAERNCPGSSVCVGTADSVSASASAPPKTRENASVFGYIPTACRHEHRKKPASGELHASECRLRAVDLGSWSAASFGRPEDGSPRGQTRRRKSSGHWQGWLGFHVTSELCCLSMVAPEQPAKLFSGALLAVVQNVGLL